MALGIFWMLPPLSNSWITVIIWLYIALNRTPNIDCYWVGAVPKVYYDKIPIYAIFYLLKGDDKYRHQGGGFVLREHSADSHIGLCHTVHPRPQSPKPRLTFVWGFYCIELGKSCLACL